MRTIELHWQNRDINDIEGEVWKDIAGTDGGYQVSNFARVRSLKRNPYYTYENNVLIKHTHYSISKQHLNNKGYIFVCMAIPGRRNPKQCLVHILVAKAFIDNPHNKLEVHHIINNPTYNRLENLEWVTRKENVARMKTDTEKANFISIVKPNNAITKAECFMREKGFRFIYCLIEGEDKVFYVGQSISPDKRFIQHKADALLLEKKNIHNGVSVYVKYLMDNKIPFRFDILKKCKEDEWQKWEIYYIKEFRKKFDLLNISDGAQLQAKSTGRLIGAKVGVPTLQYDLDGNFLKEWPSAKKANEYYELTLGLITNAIKIGGTCAGFIWKHKKSEDFPLSIPPQGKLPKILQYNIDGYFIREFDNFNDAARQLNIKATNIGLCVNGAISYTNKFIFRKHTEGFPLKIDGIIKEKTFKPIFQIMPDGSKKRFNSVKEASQELGIERGNIRKSYNTGVPVKGIIFEKDLSNIRWENPFGRFKF